jgi:Ca2+-binding EF-hand superfamily protein
LLWGTGDTVAQVAESQMSRSEQGLNVNRVGGAVTHGILVGGVMANLWYIFLDKVVSSRFIEGSIQFCSAKMGMEFFLWAPFNLFCFAVISEVADGRDWQKLKKELQETFVLTWIVDAGLQSPLDFINFRFVPPNLQALYACGISFAEAIALSLVNSRGGDAPPQEASSVLGRKSSLLIFKSLLRQLSADNFEDLETVLARGREEFESLDVAGKGYLTIPQLEAAVRMRGLVPGGCDDAVRSEVLRAVVRKVDKDGSGKVKLQNYLSFLRSFHDAGVRRSFMVDVIFNAFDTSGDRKLDLSELTNVVSALGDALSSKDMAAEIIRQCDSNKDGSISPEELKDLLLKTC